MTEKEKEEEVVELPGNVRSKDMEDAVDHTPEKTGKAEIATDRKYTDCICCLVFLAWICGMMGVSFWSFGAGNPAILLTKFDSDGNICGNATA